MKKIVFSLCLILMMLSVKSQVIQLTNPLLQGGNVNQFTHNGTNVFISSDGGIFKTNNAGTNWNYCNINSIYTNQATDIVVINNNIYASLDDDNADMFTSADNGTTWSAVTTSGFPDASLGWQYGLGGVVNSTMFRFYFQYDISGGPSDSVFIYTTTNGTSWTKGAWIGIDDGSTTNFLNVSNTKLFFTLGGNVYYTTDGNTITMLPLVSGLTSFNTDYLYAEPSNDILYYTDQTIIGVFKLDLTVMPLQWTNIRMAIAADSAVLIPNFVAADNLILAMDVDTLNNVKYLRSTNHGVSFDTISLANCGLMIPGFDDICKVSSNSLYATGGMTKSLYYSADNGTTWATINNGFYGLQTSDLVQKGDSLLTYVDNGRGVMRSLDGGVTWNLSNTGLSSLDYIVNCDNIFKLGGNTVFAIAEIVSTTQQGTNVYKSADYGATWTLTTTQPVAKALNITYEGKNGNLGIFVMVDYIDSLGNNKQALCRTINAGNTWAKVGAGLASFNLTNIYGVNGKGVADTLLLFAADANGDDILLLSVDDGLTWQLSFTATTGYFKLNGGYTGKPVTNFGGITNSPVFVVTDYSLSDIGIDRIYTCDSIDGWYIVPVSGLPADLHINTIKYMDSIWYAGTTEGIYRSIDLVNWTSMINTNFYQGMYVSNLQLSTTSNTLYLATAGNSLWVYDITDNITELTKPNESFSMYPIPAKDLLNVVLKADVLPSTIEIYSIEGKLMLKQQITNKQTIVNVNSLAQGIYLVKMNYNDKQVVDKFTVVR